MSGQLSWTREGETLALHGELDQDLLVPLWEARAQGLKQAKSPGEKIARAFGIASVLRH